MKFKHIIYPALLCVSMSLMMLSCAKDEKPVENTITLSSTDDNVSVEDAVHATANIPPTGGTITLNIDCPAEWTLLHDADEPWYEYSVDGNVLTLSAGEIVSNYQRTSMIRVWDSQSSWAYITVNQIGSEAAAIELDVDSLNFPEWGGRSVIRVSSNKEWTVTGYEDAEWMDVSVVGDSVVVTTSTNEVAERLSAMLKFSCGTEVNNTAVEIPVYQEPWTEAYLTLSQPLAAMPADGGHISLEITSNRPVTAASSASWLKAEVVDTVLVLTSDKVNAGTEPAMVIVSTPDEAPAKDTVTVTPYGDPMVLGYTIPASSEVEVYVPLSVSSDMATNVYVDWGDGSSGIMYASGGGAFTRPGHIYESAGNYTVKIYGVCPVLMTGFGSEDWASCLTSVDSWGSFRFTGSMNYGLYGTGIKRLPANTGEVMRKVTSFNSMFQGSALEEIPSGLFSGTSATSLSAVFRECANLKTIPADLFEGAENLTSVTAMFMGSGVEEIPAGLFNPLPNLRTLTNVFAECYNIKSIPAGIFAKNPELTGVSGVFRSTAIIEIPADLFANNPKIYQVYELFFGCTGITEIPQGLFNNLSGLMYANGIFNGCTSLTSVPSVLFADCPQLTETSYLFNGCTSLETVPADMFSACPELTNISNLFTGCTSLSEVPVSIFDNNRKLNNVAGLFQGCSSITGESPYTMSGDAKVHLYERENHTDEFTRISRFTDSFDGAAGFTDYASVPDWWK